MAKRFHILLADDDADDRFFFKKALEELTAAVHLSTVANGEELMHFLSKNIGQLPDLLFLDLNMPRKNGSECLAEIKQNKKLQDLPVIIYSTSLNEDVADILYANGAHYYVRKTGIAELKKTLEWVLMLMLEKKFARPPRNKFILAPVQV